MVVHGGVFCSLAGVAAAKNKMGERAKNGQRDDHLRSFHKLSCVNKIA